MSDRDCTCPHGERPLGRLYGVDMGHGMVRLSTTPGCPAHDSCRGYVKAYRAGLPSWSNPWCPKHGLGPCPTGRRQALPSDPTGVHGMDRPAGAS